MKRELQLTDVSEEKLNLVEEDFKSDGALKVIKEKQGNGLWTIRAVLDYKTAE